jgi:peptidoglycan/LPS O-acetylase OafA/YrhL
MTKHLRYDGLDLLRIVAAYLVFFNHLGQFNPHYDAAAHGVVEGGPLAFSFMGGFSGVGSVGVEIFFVISGFVISASVHGTTPGEFLRRRAIRVFPALWICATIALLVRAAAGEPLGYLAGCWLKSAFLSPIGPYIDGVVWTLVVEAVFYGLVFFWLLFVKRPLLGLARIIGFCSAAFLIVFAAARFWELHAFSAVLDRFPFKVLLLRDGVFFAAGILFDAWIEQGRPARSWRLIGFFLAFGVVEIIVSSTHAAALTVAIWAVGMAWLLACVVYRDFIESLVRIAPKFVGQLGRMSYTLYLTHYAFGMVIVSALFSLGLSEPFAFVSSLAIVTAVAWGVMAGPERATQAILRARLSEVADTYHRYRLRGTL